MNNPMTDPNGEVREVSHLQCFFFKFYFLNTLPFISGPLSQGWRGGGTIVKYMKIFTGIDIVDWNQYHFFCLIDDDTFQPGCTAFWISLTLAPGYDFENFLDWPQVSHRLQRRAISALRLKYKLCSFSERRQLAQWFWQRPFQRRVRMDYNYLNV